MSQLKRSRSDRWIAGIVGGLAKQMKVSSSVLRLIVIVLGLITAILPLVLVYLIAWLIIPSE